MKIVFFKAVAILMVFLFTSNTYSQVNKQENKSPEERAKQQTIVMKKKLSLDSTVVKEVYKINLKYITKNQSLRNSNLSKVQKYKELKASSDERDKEMKAILTSEQFASYLQMKEEAKKKLKERRQGETENLE